MMPFNALVIYVALLTAALPALAFFDEALARYIPTFVAAISIGIVGVLAAHTERKAKGKR